MFNNQNKSSAVLARPKHLIVALCIFVAAAAALLAILLPRASNATNQQSEKKELQSSSNIVFASPGRIEGRVETTEVGSGIDGVLSVVLVEEGQKVKAGQIIARLDCRDIESGIAADDAAVESTRQARERLLRGSRDEERRVAEAETASAKSVLQQARLQHTRMVTLVDQGVVSHDDLERARRDLDVAMAALRAAEEREKLANASALPEEKARANADVLAAEEKVKVDKAKLGKCSITAPISGTVLRVILKAGETVSTIARSPIISLTDTSQLRVRAEVDERDIAHVSTGKKVRVIVDAYPDREFFGRVIRIGESMGRKAVHTGDPSEKSDRDVLDVLVEMDSTDARLVVGLRVTAQFLSAP